MKERLRGVKLALLLLCFVAFTLYAMYFNSFGANAEATMAFFGIDETANGAILTVQAAGCLAMTVLLGLFGERINKLTGIALGLLLMGIGGVCIGFLPVLSPAGNYPLMLLFSLLAGIGYITIDLLMNSVVADVFPEDKTRLLPYVHAFYGGGAMLAPLFVTLLVRPERPQTFSMPYLMIGLVSVCAAAAFALAGRRARPLTPYADMTAIRSRARSNPAEIFRERKAWFFLLSGFLYLCFQTGITTWLPRYCSELRGSSFAAAGLTVTVYFLGALVMRLISPFVYASVGVRRAYRGTLLLSAVLFLVFLFVPMPELAMNILIGCIGLLQGASVPSLVLLCCDAFPARTASASSIVLFGVSLSAMVAPAVMGAIIVAAGVQAAMLTITACLILAVFVLPAAEKPARIPK